MGVIVDHQPAPNPTARPYIRARASGPHWYAKWSRNGTPIVRALGKAWAEADGNGGFQLKRGRPPQGALTEAQAAEKMLRIVREHHEEQALLERDAQERRRRGVAFREVAGAYLAWMEEVKGAKPSTMRNHRSLLAEPGRAYRRGRGTTEGCIMRVLGDRPAQAVTTREIEQVLAAIARTGVSPSTVNRARSVISAVYSYGMRPSRLDPSALRRRYERARNAAGLEPLRFHDLRHTYGSLLVAGGIDLVSVKAAMGHARLSTTERYLHALPAAEQAERFTRAFAGRES